MLTYTCTQAKLAKFSMLNFFFIQTLIKIFALKRWKLQFYMYAGNCNTKQSMCLSLNQLCVCAELEKFIHIQQSPIITKPLYSNYHFIRNFSQYRPKRMHFKPDYLKHTNKLFHLERTIKGHVRTHGFRVKRSEQLSLSQATPSCHLRTLFLPAAHMCYHRRAGAHSRRLSPLNRLKVATTE